MFFVSGKKCAYSNLSEMDLLLGRANAIFPKVLLKMLSSIENCCEETRPIIANTFVNFMVMPIDLISCYLIDINNQYPVPGPLTLKIPQIFSSSSPTIFVMFAICI